MSIRTYQYVSGSTTFNHVAFTFENGVTLSIQSGTAGYVNREAVTNSTEGESVRMAGENHEIAFMTDDGGFFRPVERHDPDDFAHDDVLGHVSTEVLAWYTGKAPTWKRGVDFPRV